MESGRILSISPLKPVYFNMETGIRIFFSRQDGMGWCFGKDDGIDEGKGSVCSKKI